MQRDVACIDDDMANISSNGQPSLVVLDHVEVQGRGAAQVIIASQDQRSFATTSTTHDVLPARQA